MNRDEIWGLEYDFLATDAAGAVAFVSTAGQGDVPDEFLADVESYAGAIDLLMATKPSCQVRCSQVVAPDLPNPWAAMGERGLYAYDWSVVSERYECVSVPGRAVLAGSLTPRVREVCLRFRLSELRFAMSPPISLPGRRAAKHL
jgi:hypothetical protein